jgi:hypothetical protein
VPVATTPRQQILAIDALIARAVKLGPIDRIAIAADMAAAQLELNKRIVDELEHQAARLELIERKLAQ